MTTFPTLKVRSVPRGGKQALHTEYPEISSPLVTALLLLDRGFPEFPSLRTRCLQTLEHPSVCVIVQPFDIDAFPNPYLQFSGYQRTEVGTTWKPDVRLDAHNVYWRHTEKAIGTEVAVVVRGVGGW